MNCKHSPNDDHEFSQARKQASCKSLLVCESCMGQLSGANEVICF